MKAVGGSLSRVRAELTALRVAIQFLTRLPLPDTGPAPPAALARCPVYFPLVGALLGGLIAAVIAGLLLVWPIPLAVLVALGIEARLTGALHEDAVADYCDALGGGWTREDCLRILKDSRVGSYGVLGLTLAVALRAGALMWIIAMAQASATPFSFHPISTYPISTYPISAHPDADNRDSSGVARAAATRVAAASKDVSPNEDTGPSEDAAASEDVRAAGTVLGTWGVSSSWTRWAIAVIASSMLGRWAILVVMTFLPPVVERASLARDVGSQLNLAALAYASLWTAPVVIALGVAFQWRAAFACGLLLLIIVVMSRSILRKLGGVTGDCLGCVGYAGQVAVLLGLAAGWPA
jgi:cobalamin synthase